jgi:hypothetical protein
MRSRASSTTAAINSTHAAMHPTAARPRLRPARISATCANRQRRLPRRLYTPLPALAEWRRKPARHPRLLLAPMHAKPPEPPCHAALEKCLDEARAVDAAQGGMSVMPPPPHAGEPAPPPDHAGEHAPPPPPQHAGEQAPPPPVHAGEHAPPPPHPMPRPESAAEQACHDQAHECMMSEQPMPPQPPHCPPPPPHAGEHAPPPPPPVHAGEHAPPPPPPVHAGELAPPPPQHAGEHAPPPPPVAGTSGI